MLLRKGWFTAKKTLFSLISALLVATSVSFATEVELENRAIDLNNSLVKWFLIMNRKPSSFGPELPKLTLATMAEEDMGDYAYLLEVNRELRRVSTFDSIPVELAVVTTPDQRERFYKYFAETSQLDIRWIIDNEGPEYQAAVQEFENSSQVLFLSAWPKLQNPISPSWLNVTHYSDIPEPNEDRVNFVIHKGQLSENYYQEANVGPRSSTCLQRREDEDEVEILDPDRLIVEARAEEDFCDLYNEQEYCEAPITFGLGKKTVGMPFNSVLSKKVNRFEQAGNKSKTQMARDFKALLKEKPWLGQALSGYRKTSSPLETIKQLPYYIAYYHSQAFLKEYLAIISQIDDNAPTVVLNISLKELQSAAYRGMFADLGYGVVHYRSETQNVAYQIPEAWKFKTIHIVNPGPVASQDAYNALIYFSHPLILVAGNLSLAKVISMHKIPLYEWRSFQTDVNTDLKAHWKGTHLESFFENRYAPDMKAQSLKAFDFNPQALREVSQRIMKKHDVMPALLDTIWLAHQPSHPLWELDTYAQEMLSSRISRGSLLEILAVQDSFKREVLAGKLILHHLRTASLGLMSYELEALFTVIKDPVIKAYLRSMQERF